MVKQSRRKNRSRSQRRRLQSRRRQQRGGGASLLQGADFQSRHTMQHGGFRALEGAPLDYSGVLEGGMRGAAGLAGADSHFSQAQAYGQTGGSRRRRRQRGGSLSPADVSQSYTLLKDYTGAGLSAPPADGPLVPYIVTGGDRVQQANAPMKGGRRGRKSRSRRGNKSRSKSRSRRQRGGYAPVAQASMLLTDYSKAGLPDFKAL